MPRTPAISALGFNLGPLTFLLIQAGKPISSFPLLFLGERWVRIFGGSGKGGLF